MVERRSESGARRKFVFFFCIVAFLFLVAGVFLTLRENKNIRKFKYDELQAIAQLKIYQITKWRKERLGDAFVLSNEPEIIRFLEKSDKERTDLIGVILSHLGNVKKAYDYSDVILADTAGNILASMETKEKKVIGNTAEMVKMSENSRRVFFGKLYKMPDSDMIVIDVFAPVKDSSENVIGIVILRENLDRYLFPLIQSWPTPSRTSETLIVRKERDGALFLNEPRHNPGEALKLHIPLAQEDLPAAKAISGITGMVQGIDYRGVSVVADIRPVPGFPWFMVAKVDKNELLAEAKIRVIFIFSLTLLFIILVGAIFGVLFYKQQRNLYKDLHAAECYLAEAREWFRKTLYSIGDAVITTDLNGNILQMNNIAENLTGWSENEAKGKSIHTVFHIVNEETREEVENPVDKVIRSGAVVGLANHTILIDRNGREYPIADSGAPIRTADADVQGVVLVFRDKTEARNRERLLHENSEKLLMALESANQVIFDVNIRIDDVGDSQLPASPPASFFEEHAEWYERIHPDDRDNAIQRFWDFVCEKTDNYRSEYRVLREAGDSRWILARGKITQRDERGFPTRIMGTHTDVTDQKRLEQQYFQAQKMEAVGRLAGGVAHDFNNMLNVILGYSDMLLSRVDGDSQTTRDVRQIRKAAVRSAELTRQLLAFARRQHISPRTLDMNETIGNCLSMLERMIGEDIKLDFIPDKKIGRARMDPAQVEQILMNLVVNARDAINGVGSISIETGTAVFDEEYCRHHPGFRKGRYVRIICSDSGAGIDKMALEHIFEPFFTTKKEGEGTGLGLSTVYGIVKQNDGFINVYSEKGMGTIFKIYLPLYEGEEETVSEIPTNKVMTGDETVLVVEDELQILSLSKRMLEESGYTVLTAQTAKDAFEISRDYPQEIHALITDVIMPEVSGKEIQERICSERPKIKTLYMSGYTADVVAHHGIISDGLNFIQKPFSQIELTNKLREVLEDDDTA